MHLSFPFSFLLAATALACAGSEHSCYGAPARDLVLTRHVRRAQPDAQNASTGPSRPLEWGQVNFLHTTDTHGWLEGHVKERNYGADWGDYASFVKRMRGRARDLKVDLLLVDTGDLHDGAGLSDATTPNGNVSNALFENIDYDLLTIGNHELYISEIAYETFNQFAKLYGDRYLTSNVQILNPTTRAWEYIGKRYRYFETESGVRIMAFGVLFDFTGNSNVSKVIKARDMVEEQWFLDAVNYPEPVDLFMVIGHNPVRTNDTSSTIGTVINAIRKVHPETPVQAFGGHSHIRDFVVYDEKATGLESGRYCETLGWLALSGVGSSKGKSKVPIGVPNPTRKAIPPTTNTTTSSYSVPRSVNSSDLLVARRYLDWNRLTFAYHAEGSQAFATFDTDKGKNITSEITSYREKLNLTALYGCAPQSYCQTCKPFLAEGNLFKLLQTALSTVVVNKSRKDVPRLIIINTGSVRFDLAKGPFTYDDSFIVSPFQDAFEFLPDVPYAQASKVLDILNAGPWQKKKRDTDHDEGDLSTADFGFTSILTDRDLCVDPPLANIHAPGTLKRSTPGRVIRRQALAPSPGYTTTDDFGPDGDDTVHARIPHFPQPNDLQANASFPLDGSLPDTVDLVFLDFITPNVLAALNSADVGGDYRTEQVAYYLDKRFTTNSYLPEYARVAWQEGVPRCPVGEGIGS